MPRLIATNIRLEPEQHNEIKLRAAREKKSYSQVVREAVDAHLGRAEPTSAGVDKDPFWEVLGIGEGPVRDGSVNHDHYLYGWPKEAGGSAVRRHRRVHRPGR